MESISSNQINRLCHRDCGWRAESKGVAVNASVAGTRQSPRHWIQDLCWLVAPFWGTKTLLLPIPPQQINNWLLRHLDGEWSVDGGPNGRMLWLTRNSHIYRGVIQGNSFTLTGPLHARKVPMVVRGICQPEGTISNLYLSMRLASIRLTWMLLLPLVQILIFIVVVNGFLQSQGMSATPIRLVLLVMAILWFGGAYINIVIMIHWQTHLLIRHLTACADESTQ